MKSIILPLCMVWLTEMTFVYSQQNLRLMRAMKSKFIKVTGQGPHGLRIVNPPKAQRIGPGLSETSIMPNLQNGQLSSMVQHHARQPNRKRSGSGDLRGACSSMVLDNMDSERPNYHFPCRKQEVLGGVVTDSDLREFSIDLENNLGEGVDVKHAWLYVPITATHNGVEVQVVAKLQTLGRSEFTHVDLYGGDQLYDFCFKGSLTDWLQTQSQTKTPLITILVDVVCQVSGRPIECSNEVTVGPPMLLLDTKKMHCQDQNLMSIGYF